MSLLNQHLHSIGASVTAAATSVMAPVPDILTKILIGTATGVLTWAITKGLAALYRKIKKT